jgi:uncharacterized RDD family membrane protein YckC
VSDAALHAQASPPPQPPVPAGARCAVHGERTAVIVCARCGNFACAECENELDGERFCGGCVDRISPLADPGRRLAAHLIDGISTTLPLSLVALAATARAGTVAWLLLALGAGGLLLVLGVNVHWVQRYGQSIAKRWLKLRVVHADGRRMTLWRILLARNVLPNALAIVPIAGPLFALLDPLFVFGKQRRTLHDRLADSIVISVREQGSRR